jgi:chromosomal replication initiator protein
MTALALKIENADSVKNVINSVKNIIKSKIDESAFNAWFEPISISQIENKIILTAASRFNADFIRATYGRVLDEAAAGCGMKIELSFSRPSLRILTAAPQPAAKPAADGFGEFICSDANRFALSAVKKCADGKASFSPLVIYGASGCGKSMLLDLLSKNTGQSVLATTGPEFVSEFVRAMQGGSIFSFKDKMRAKDMFIMDDIQGLAGKRASAEEFATLLSDLIRMGKNVVLTSNIQPSQIAGFDKRLVSMLASGLSVDLAAPDSHAREKILEKSGIDSAAAKSIAERAPANGHVVAGISKKIAAWVELDCGELSEQVLEKLLCDVLLRRNTPAAMVKSMCAKLGVAFEEVMSATRARKIVFARQKIMAALKISTPMSLADIGRAVGGRDHASVLYAISQIEKAKESDMLLDSEIRQLNA